MAGRERARVPLTGANSAGSGPSHRAARHPHRLGHRRCQRNDLKLLGPTLDDVARFGLLHEVETLHLDRGYDYPKVRRELVGFGLGDVCIQRRSKPGITRPAPKAPLPLGQRWIVESTNSWLSNYGQLRRNTDRHSCHRHAQLCLVVALIIVAKLIDWRTVGALIHDLSANPLSLSN